MSSSSTSSVDLTSQFNELLRQKNAPPCQAKLSLDTVEGFLKEAYRINAHITTLHRELLDVRQTYLSTAQPRKGLAKSSQGGQSRSMTDRDREVVDANAKQMVRELNAGIRALGDAETLRRETEAAMINKKYGSSLGALGSWASGGITSNKSVEHKNAEVKAQQTEIHRDGILWFLRQRLELCCRTQQDMMETRLTRELEKSRDFMPPPSADFADFAATSRTKRAMTGGSEATNHGPDADLTNEQVQMFEEGNQDMMRHYEGSLDKVRTAEKSLLEISELQSMLVSNLATQSAHIEQLVTDSMSTTDNVGGGNKELKKATQRPSAARYTFFAASGLCAFLIVWDLII